MRALISADWHLSDDPRDAYRVKIVEKEIIPLIRKHSVDVFFYLGDICEAKDQHRAELVNLVVRLFSTIARDCLVVFVQGNHDWFSSPTHPFFGFLRRLKNIYWIDQPTEVDPLLKNEGLKSSLHAILLPHTADFERDWGGIDFKKYDWAFAHQTFTNARGDSGVKLSGVPLSYFPKKLSIISGDVHLPQNVGPLTYVGSPYHVDFGDDFEPRVLLLDERGDAKSIPIKGPQKRLVDVGSIENLRAKGFANQGDILKLRIEIQPEQQSDWPAIAEKARAWAKATGVQIHALQPVVVGGQRGASAKRKAATRTDEQLLKDYAAARGVDEKVLKVGVRLL